MSRLLYSRSAAQPLSRCFNSHLATRSFTTSAAQRKDEQPKLSSFLEDLYGKAQPEEKTQAPETNSMSSLTGSSIFKSFDSSSGGSRIDVNALLNGTATPTGQGRDLPTTETLEPYHFHVYAHKHNTHVTCTRPNREPIISMSCGNLGYRKSRRSTFDSAYSLTKYVIERLIHKGIPPKIHKLEVVLQGFGQGREGALKVLMSPEGKILRDKVVRVADSTKLKFGGTRSPRPKRR
ncbi:uncharacterized protein F5Z01DRAFT_657304 [Emericellopsis atlantica]|uniref:Uncharacterized protein n=1 Tax=Emericellopsis atlantica TaxID=2614577 RepID=A0A9P7ZJX7_9HYPO|nr:uncharacterized protein F5Z01DRAFT_657304 [Emericellopsis atlantica]KAG9253479.1 hypothetical protein F5Z01DRAFT_657304 [Emericellopsis atlantica]